MLGGNILCVCVHPHMKHTRKMCLGNYFFGDNCLILSVDSEVIVYMVFRNCILR